MQAAVTYLHHSGMAVQTCGHYLVFDYDGSLPAPDLERLKKPGAAVFASHRHPDHFCGQIVEWKRSIPSMDLILSDDIPCREQVVRLGSHSRARLEGIKVYTLDSTDQGVAFLVKADGLCVYHAGDLNWWHWFGEPDAFNLPMEKTFKREVDRLRGEVVDLAFLPADPRQGDAEFWGLTYFMDTIGAKAVVPMHRWDDDSVLGRISLLWEQNGWRGKLLPLKTPGETICLSY